MRIFALIFLLMVAFNAPAFAQFTGGDGDGYSDAESADAGLGGKVVTISSRGNQVFMVGASAQTIAPITVTDVQGGGITAVDGTGDIRIRIPAGFNMAWDASVGTAVLGGGAAAKCAAAVSYENSNSILRVNVTSNFTAGQSVVISGLRFNNFSGISSVDNLEIDFYNGNLAQSYDDKIISIIGDTETLYLGGDGDGSDASESGDYVFGSAVRAEGVNVEGVGVE
jgi:hypothetical protein